MRAQRPQAPAAARPSAVPSLRLDRVAAPGSPVSARAASSMSWRDRARSPFVAEVDAELRRLHARSATPRAPTALSSTHRKFESVTQRSATRESVYGPVRGPSLKHVMRGIYFVDEIPTAELEAASAQTQTFEDELRTVRSKRLSQYPQIGTQELRVLQHLFSNIAPSGVVDVHLFVQIMRCVLSTTENELKRLFRQIDVDDTGSVTWDTLVAFLHASADHARSAANRSAVPQFVEMTKPVRRVTHKGMINGVCMMPALQLMATSGYDGLVKIWHADSMAHRYTLTPLAHSSYASQDDAVNLEVPALATASLKERGITPRGSDKGAETSLPFGHVKASDLYPTDMSFSDGLRKFYVSALDGTVTAYDTRKQFREIASVHTSGLPTSLVAFQHPETQAEVLTVGDSSGTISSFSFNEETMQFALERKLAAHTEPISRLRWFESIGYVSASMDSTVQVVDTETLRVSSKLEGHARAVLAFDYGPERRMLATAGFDRVVNIWNPYVNRVTWSLKGHRAQIISVMLHEGNNQLVSVSSDKMVKVWDLRRLECVQTFSDDAVYFPHNVVTAATVDWSRRRLITCGDYIHPWPIDQSDGEVTAGAEFEADTRASHNSRVIGVHFSESFGRLISVDQLGIVKLWDVKTGLFLSEWRAAHEGPVTTSCVDKFKRRLLTGGHDGTIKMWNFSTGELQHVFAARSHEITCLAWVSRPGLPFTLAAGGWDHLLGVYPEVHLKMGPHVLKHHAGDVVDVIATSTHLYSAGAEGTVVCWSLTTFSPVRVFQMPAGADDVPTPICKIALDTEKRALLCGLNDGRVLLFDAQSGAQVVTNVNIRLKDAITVLSFDAKFKALCACDVTGQFVIYSYAPDLIRKRCRLNEVCCMEAHFTDGVTFGAGLIAPDVIVLGTEKGYVMLFAWNGERLGMLNSGRFVSTPFLLQIQLHEQHAAEAEQREQAALEAELGVLQPAAVETLRVGTPSAPSSPSARPGSSSKRVQRLVRAQTERARAQSQLDTYLSLPLESTVASAGTTFRTQSGSIMSSLGSHERMDTRAVLQRTTGTVHSARDSHSALGVGVPARFDLQLAGQAARSVSVSAVEASGTLLQVPSAAPPPARSRSGSRSSASDAAPGVLSEPAPAVAIPALATGRALGGDGGGGGDDDDDDDDDEINETYAEAMRKRKWTGVHARQMRFTPRPPPAAPTTSSGAAAMAAAGTGAGPRASRSRRELAV